MDGESDTSMDVATTEGEESALGRGKRQKRASGRVAQDDDEEVSSISSCTSTDDRSGSSRGGGRQQRGRGRGRGRRRGGGGRGRGAKPKGVWEVEDGEFIPGAGSESEISEATPKRGPGRPRKEEVRDGQQQPWQCITIIRGEATKEELSKDYLDTVKAQALSLADIAGGGEEDEHVEAPANLPSKYIGRSCVDQSYSHAKVHSSFGSTPSPM